jgi:hypothetical protein
MARDVLARHFLPKLTVRLRRRWTAWESELVPDAVEDTIISYLDRPWRYDPSRGSLENYLSHNSHRRAQTLRRGVLRRLARERPTNAVDLEYFSDVTDSSPPLLLSDAGASERNGVMEALCSLATTDAEIAALTVYLDCGSDSAQAKATGIAPASATELKQGIRRVIKRLRERARRRGWRSPDRRRRSVSKKR